MKIAPVDYPKPVAKYASDSGLYPKAISEEPKTKIEPLANRTPDRPTAESPATPAEEKQPVDKMLTEESARYIDALSKVLAKAIVEDHKAWEEIMAKATQQMAQPVEKPEASAEAAAEKTPAKSPAAIPAPPKPNWLGMPWRDSSDGVFSERDVEVGPFPSRRECDAKLPKEIQKAIDEYVDSVFPDSRGVVKLPPEEMQNIAPIKSKFEEWRYTQSMGDVLTLHALVQIDQDKITNAYRQAQARYAETHRRAVADARLWHFSVSFAAGFLLLSAVWGYLKADLATGGKRRGILRAAVSVVILAIVATLAMVA